MSKTLVLLEAEFEVSESVVSLPVLTAQRVEVSFHTGNGIKKSVDFIITDRFKEVVGIYNRDSLKEFIDGKKSIKDTADRSWSFNQSLDSMKPNQKELEEFIGSSTK